MFLNLKYDFTERASLNFQAISGSSESVFYNQPSNMTIAGTQYAWTIRRENPYLPATLATEMDRLGMASIQITPAGIIDGPGRINIYDNRGDESIGELESYTVGFDFDITDNWTLNFDYQQGESTVETGILNVPRIDKFFLAVDAVRHPTTQQIVCQIAVVNPTPRSSMTPCTRRRAHPAAEPARSVWRGGRLADRPAEPARVRAVQSVRAR